MGDEQVERIALAQVDEAIAQEEAKIRAVNEASTPVARLLSPVREARSESPASGSDTLVHSITLSRSDSGGATQSADQIDEYTTQLQKLAERRSYAQIPAIFESMLRSGVKPSVSAYNALLSAAINLPRSKHQVVDRKSVV